jgi:ornithine carbamoyltransferase
MKLISTHDLSGEALELIFSMADAKQTHCTASSGSETLPVAWSFEGQGIRTRASFLQAFRDLGLAYTELPNLLKTSERVEDLAAYLDPWFSIYVIRESNHERLAAFAGASRRPVINAMSAFEHPCEVITDAFYIDRMIKPLRTVKLVLWGPSTNVFRSWEGLAAKGIVSVLQVDATGPLPDDADLVITDVDPAGQGVYDAYAALTQEHLGLMGNPALLPTPPFQIGREISFDPVNYSGFVGYAQKSYLVPVQRAIMQWLLAGAR